MIHVHVSMFDGTIYDLSLKEGNTILDVKNNIPSAYPWQIRLFPFIQTCDDTKEDEDPVEAANNSVIHDGDMYRAFVDSTDTRILYFSDVGPNPWECITNELMIARMSVFYLEKGEHRHTFTGDETTSQTQYYFDSESLMRQLGPAYKDNTLLDGFLKLYLKEKYHGHVDTRMDFQAAYRIAMSA